MDELLKQLDLDHERALLAEDPTSDVFPEGCMSAAEYFCLPIEERWRISKEYEDDELE